MVAAVAKVQPLWALLRVRDRARYMGRMAQAVIDDFDELQEALAREQGRPRAEIAALELLAAIDALKWIAEDGAQALSARRVGVNRSLALAKRASIAFEPYGVVGVIGAGSAPFAQPLGQIAGALLAGNGVVFKPAPRARPRRRADRAGARARRAARGARAGRPRRAPTSASRSRRRRSTRSCSPARPPSGGSSRAPASRARRRSRSSSAARTRCSCSPTRTCGARSAARCGRAAPGPDRRGDRSSACTSRARSTSASWRASSTARAELAVGDPADQRVQVGPLASARRAAARERARRGGRRPGRAAALRRTGEPRRLRRRRLLRARRDHRREQPTCACCASRSTDPCSCSCRSTPSTRRSPPPTTGDYGLGASVWTADRYQGLRIARELHAGMVWLNDHLPGPTVSRGPWGAAAGGGLGRTLGQAGLRACAQEKLITWDPPAMRGLWWGPVRRHQPRRRCAPSPSCARARESDRDRAWREGALALARVGARAFGRGLPRSTGVGHSSPAQMSSRLHL